MNDLDELRGALAEPPGFRPRPLDLDAVLTQGGRIRRRRRLAAASSAGVAVAVLVIGGVQITGPGRAAGPAPAGPAASPSVDGRSASPSVDGRSASPSVDGRSAPPSESPEDRARRVAKEADAREFVPTGEPVRTGLVLDGAALDLWMQRSDPPGLQGSLHIVLIARTSEVTETVANSGDPGPYDTPGFHATWETSSGGGSGAPPFGYFVGPADRITARQDGRTITARLATWSEDPNVKVFWIDPEKVDRDRPLADLRAYRDGRRLPDGGRTTFFAG